MRTWTPAAWAVAALLAGCAGPATAPRAGPAEAVVPATEVAATATQTRPDTAAGGRFEITVTNTGGRPFTVTAVRLDSPGFTLQPPAQRDEPFAPGDRYDLPAPYGPVLCNAKPVPAHAVVRLHRDGGVDSDVRVPLASPDRLLLRIHERECAAERLARQVRVSLAGLHRDGDHIVGALRVERGELAGRVDVVELRGTVVHDLAAPLPARLMAGADRLDVPVAVRAATCDGHRLAETKQPYLFRLFLRLDGGLPQEVDLPTSDEQRQLLQALVRRVCG